MSASWVRASLPPMLGPLPAWVIIPLPFVFLRFGVMSITIFLVVVLTAGYLSHKGRTLMWTVRRARTALRGYRMEARPLGYRRAMNMDVAIHEFDFESWRNL